MALERTERAGRATMFAKARQSAPRGGRLRGGMALRLVAMMCAGAMLVMQVAGCKDQQAKPAQSETKPHTHPPAPPHTHPPAPPHTHPLAPAQAPALTLNMVLEAARPSVYMVIVQEMPEGQRQYVERLMGTAWVVGDGVLATNAHIAEEFDKLEIDSDNPEGGPVQLVVRSLGGVAGQEPRTHVVTGAVIHPGYKDFTTMWDDYMPMNSATSDLDRADLVDMPGPACDVGFLTVTEPDRLAPRLEMATAEELASLRIGDEVGLIGYSAENVSAVTVLFPSPKTHKGHISSITDYFGVTRRESNDGAYLGHLIHHTCPAEGGASGSPILAANGKVIALLNAGDVIGTSGGRVSMAGFLFAQRVDLLRELLEPDHAAQVQVPRSREWRSTMKRVYAEGRALLSRPELWFKRETERIMAEVGSGAPVIVSSNEASLPRGRNWTQSVQTLSVQLKPGSVYMAIAASPDLMDIDIHVLNKSSGEVMEEDTATDWYPWAVWEAESDDVEIIVSGVPGTRYEFRLYKFR